MRRASILGTTLLALSGCGPTEQEIGVSMVGALVLIVPLAALINYGLYRLWCDARELDAPRAGEAGVATLGVALIAGALSATAAAVKPDLIVISGWFVSTAYLTLMCLGISVGLLIRRPWAFRWPWAAPMFVHVALALPLALSWVRGDDAELIYGFHFYVGGLGGVGGPLLLILLVVSLVARRRARLAREIEAPLPPE